LTASTTAFQKKARVRTDLPQDTSEEINESGYPGRSPGHAHQRRERPRPKPTVEIHGKPILWHVVKIYSAHGVNDFEIPLTEIVAARCEVR